jgi:curved DNA-binding protein CbpA
MPDCYEVLQVHPSADPDVVKAAYYKLATKYHPDKNAGAGAAQKMAELNQAWAVLGDPERRRQYDEYRSIHLKEAHGPRHTSPQPQAQPSPTVVYVQKPSSGDGDFAKLLLIGLGILIGVDCA